MDCNVIKDLIPLYIDGCCSSESSKLVEEHISTCSECEAVFKSMNTAVEPEPTVTAPVTFSRINDWKASILQSVLLFISFAVITVGVALEAATPTGFTNGIWASGLVIPATGFLLSLANWYFVRLYKTRKAFSTCSCLATLFFIVCAYVWSCFHYEINLADLVAGISMTDLFEVVTAVASLNGIGILLSAVFCVLSKTLSNKYAAMLGKE